MGLNWAEHTEEIEAPVEVCFDAIVSIGEAIEVDREFLGL